MTVADRGHIAATDAAEGSIAAGLDALLATARSQEGPLPLIASTQAVAPLDPIDLFAAARGLDLEVALLLQPAAGRSIVGIGRAWAVEPSGPDRFAAATSAWRAVLEGALRSGEASGSDAMLESGPRLIGGLGFTGRSPEASDSWGPFGAASLVLPTFGLAQGPTGSTLTVAFGPGHEDGLDGASIERTWDLLAREVSGTGDLPATPSTDEPEVSVFHAIGARPDRAGWDRTVGLFAGAVGRGRIDKVVLARRVVLQADADLDITAALRHLSRTAPESTTFAFVRDGTTFLGATPERLVWTVGPRFETVAIAGSAARGTTPDEDARFAAGLLASEKEREEHGVVVDMLRTSLAPIADRLTVADAPVILPLRHVQHLATPITGTLRDDAGLLALGERLHPTPAVGGAPRDVALALITEHEGFDRGWYAGPIGWLGADGDGELLVALRCGLVRGPRATLFAGCGIVADSDPAREWAESRLKLRTMIAAFGRIAEDEP